MEEDKKIVKIKCNLCGHINSEMDIDHFSCCNEEGEEYYSLNVYCGGCNKELYEGSNWGEYDLEEALEKIDESKNCTVLSS